MESSLNELVEAKVPQGSKSLICIEIPVLVRDDEKAIACLGGIDSITKAIKDVQRLELKFRPEDKLCKPAYSKSNNVTNIAIRVVKRRSASSEEASHPVYEYSVSVLGVIDTVHTFSGMADFQVLPPCLATVSEPEKHKHFQLTEPLDEKAMTSLSSLSFLPPGMFSRSDRPMGYVFRTGAKVDGSGLDKVGDLSLAVRMRRTTVSYGIPFNHKGPVPDKPRPGVQQTNSPILQPLKELFAKRPVWSRHALQAELGINQTLIKILLPLASYHFTSGPWKTLWVRLGYDPRVDPGAKMFQCFDFRMPKEVDIVSSLRYSKSEHTRWWPKLNKEHAKIGLKSETRHGAELGDKSMFSFVPEVLPSQRQVYYQLCEIHVDSLQTLLHSNDGREERCDEVWGWSEKAIYDELRKSLTEMTRKTAQRVRRELEEEEAAISS